MKEQKKEWIILYKTSKYSQWYLHSIVYCEEELTCQVKHCAKIFYEVRIMDFEEYKKK